MFGQYWKIDIRSLLKKLFFGQYWKFDARSVLKNWCSVSIKKLMFGEHWKINIRLLMKILCSVIIENFILGHYWKIHIRSLLKILKTTRSMRKTQVPRINAEQCGKTGAKCRITFQESQWDCRCRTLMWLKCLHNGGSHSLN